ncbi:MAG: BamA/TamA family outer membrane protein [Polyangiaceae bacterium]
MNGAAPLRSPRGAGLILPALTLGACAKLPPGQSATDSVAVLGTNALDEAAVEDKLATVASPKFLGLFQGVVYDYDLFNRANFQRDLARVERYYHERGYYSAHARAGRVITSRPGHVRIEIVVEEGAPTVNRELTLAGIERLDLPLRSALQTEARAALRPNAPFDEDRALKCEQDVRKALTDRGYAYARVKRDSYVDVVHRLADTTLTITPGESARFGPVVIEGLDPDASGPLPAEIPEAPLRRAIDIQEGEPYSTLRVDAATRALLDLEVFSSVTIEPDLSHPETRAVPLRVHVEPSSLRQTRLGGGVEFDALKLDLHLIAGWQDRDFLGGLRDFSFEFSPGVVLYPTSVSDLVAPNRVFPEEKLRVQLRQPGFVEAKTVGFVRSELNVFPLLVQPKPSPDLAVVGYLEFKGATGVERTFGKNLYVNLSYNAQLENPFSYKDPLDSALRQLIIAYPELGIHLDYRDNVEDPHSGFYLSNDLQVAGGIFGGDATDIKIVPEVRTYLPLGRTITFATRASVGFLFASNYGDVVQNHLDDAVTLANRYARVRDIETTLFRGLFSGGPTSNRGFVLRGVSPHGVVPFLLPNVTAQQALTCPPPSGAPANTTSANAVATPDPRVCSTPVGGFTLWELSNELRFGVSGPLSGALFCDMGDVSPHEVSIRLDHMHLSCGVGARYETPVGPIRLDIGYRVQPLQVLGFANETQAYERDPANGFQPTLFGDKIGAGGIPAAISIGIGEAY